MMMMTVMVMTRDNLEQLLIIGSLGAEGVGSLLGLAQPLTMLPAPPPSLPKQKAIIHQGALHSFLSSLLMYLHLGVRHASHCPHLAWPSCSWRMNQRPSLIPVRWPGGLPCGKRARLLCNSWTGSLEVTSPPRFLRMNAVS